MEVWKDIKDYEGLYQVSNLGNIKSVDRNVKCSDGSIRPIEGMSLKFFKNKGGYSTVSLSKNGEVKTRTVHQLVARAFIQNQNNYKQINHRDGNKTNNDVRNLEWCTPSRNIQHSYDIGIKSVPYGENSWMAKLTEKDVRRIRMARRCSMGVKEIAEMFNTTPQNVHKISSAVTWGKVPFNIVCESIN